MNDSQVADRPTIEMRWVPVTDERGLTHMQAVWIATTAMPTATHHAA